MQRQKHGGDGCRCCCGGLPCVSCSNGRQWQFAVGVPAAGDAGSCSREEAVAAGMGRRAEGLDSILRGLGDGKVAEAGGGAPPCPDGDLVVPVQVEEEETYSSGRGRGSVYEAQAGGCSAGRAHDEVSDLHEEAVGRSRGQAAVRWAAANGWEADLGHPGEGTWRREEKEGPRGWI